MYTRYVDYQLNCSARPLGRARIETFAGGDSRLTEGCSARPLGRARIETHDRASIGLATHAAPVLWGGRGLKLR
jgi:hypothetical protein